MSAPTVTINQAAGQADPVVSMFATFDVVFSENVTGFDFNDVTVSGTAGATSVSVFLGNDAAHYSVVVGFIARSGTITTDIVTGAATSIATGETSAAESFTDNTVTVIYPAAPIPDHYVMNEDSSLTVAATAGVLVNDIVSSGNTNTAVLDTGPANASSFSFNADGSFSYVPQANFNGNDSFSYHIFDGMADTAIGFVGLQVTSVNDAPVNTVPAGTFSTPSSIAITGLSVSDVDLGTVMTTTLHVDHGTLTVSPAGVTVSGSGTDTVTLTGLVSLIDDKLASSNGVLYQSATGFTGTDHLTMTSNDGGSGLGAGAALGDVDLVAISVLPSHPELFTAGNDTVTLPQAGTYFAMAGDDIVFMTGAGEATYGGSGNDTYHVEAAGDLVVELVNEGIDTVQTASLAACTLGANVENLTHTGINDFTGVGNALNNVIVGGTGNDYLVGLDGNDTLIDGSGLNTLQGGKGDDIYAVQSNADTVFEFANEGTDQVQTFLPFYQLSANVENLTFIGSASHTGIGNELNNVLIGGTGNDYLIGGDGNDTLIDGNGLNTLQGGKGDDIYAVQSNADTVFEFANEGTDEVQTFLTSYTLSPNVEKLTFIGAFSHNGTGNELANTFTGSSATDTFTGAGGNDVFNYRHSGNGLDIITDFNADNSNAAEHDHIDLTGRGLSFASLAVTTVAGGVVVGIPGGDAIYLQNVAAHSVDAGDFFF